MRPGIAKGHLSLHNGPQPMVDIVIDAMTRCMSVRLWLGSFHPSPATAVLVLAVIAWGSVATANPARAGEGDEPGSERERVESAIQACWALSERERALGSTAAMRHGAAVSIACLERALQNELRALLTASSYAELDLPKRLESLSDSYQSIYWQLYNGSRPDESWRGTMYQVFHLSAYARLLESMIRDAAAEREATTP